MSIVLTESCHKKLADKLIFLKKVEQPRLSNYIDECRSMGSLEDNPEYYQAIEEMNRLTIQISDLVDILNSCIIFNENMAKKDTVMFGSTVEFINCDTEEKKTYTLCSIYDSDISTGRISIQAPFAKEMIGLHSGDIFTFNDVDYEITNIYYTFPM